jgi:hypothetical protein
MSNANSLLSKTALGLSPTKTQSKEHYFSLRISLHEFSVSAHISSAVSGLQPSRRILHFTSTSMKQAWTSEHTGLEEFDLQGEKGLFTNVDTETK